MNNLFKKLDSKACGSSFRRCLQKAYRFLGTPMAYQFAESLDNDEMLKQLFKNYPAIPQFDYCSNIEKQRRDWLAWNILRKSDIVDCGISKDEACLTSWMKTESRLKGLNSSIRSGECTARTTLMVELSRKIAAILGDFTSDDFVSNLKFTSGASTRLPRRKGSIGFKLAGTPHVTRQAQVLMNALLYTDEVYMRAKLENGPVSPISLSRVIPGSRFEMVPKTFKTYRPIAIEPDLNMIGQRAVGSLISSRLRRFGLDLRTQELNRYYAKVGASTGSLCTIDLESASDSLSLDLVKEILPPRWADLLLKLRSNTVQMADGSYHLLEKFSSMGNGYTFELESLIFLAVGLNAIDKVGCSDRRIAVFGDDIIVHNTVADTLISDLSLIGFETNRDKTYIAGPFRESCGSHWFMNHDFTPFHIKDLHNNVTDILFLQNSFNEWCKRGGLKPLFKNSTSAPIVPRSFGLRSGFISDDPLPYVNASIPIQFLTYASVQKSVPHLGLYWAKLLSCNDAELSRVVESTKRLRLRRTRLPFWS